MWTECIDATQKVCRDPLGLEKSHRLAIERHEHVPAKPLSLVRDDAIGVITTGFEERQACFRRGAIQPHGVGFDQGAQCSADLCIRKT